MSNNQDQMNHGSTPNVPNEHGTQNTQGGASTSAPASASTNKSFFQTFKDAKMRHITFNEAEINKFLRIAGLVLLSLLSVFVLVKTMSEIKSYSVIGEAGYPYVITVTGKGEVSAPKDIASLSFTSQAKGKTASVAQSKAAEANNKALAFVRSKGIAEKDISIENYNTYPTYDQKVKPCIYETPQSIDGSVSVSSMPVGPCSSYESVITGYETSQTITIKIRGINENPALSGEIIAGLGAVGVQVGNLQNTIDNPDMLKAEARAMAIDNARVQAKQIARSLRVRLGKVSSYYENDPSMRMSEGAYAPAMMDAKVISPETPAGESKITSEVSVTFEIEQ